MTERAFQPAFESGQSFQDEREIDKFLSEMRWRLAAAVNSRQAGMPLEKFGPKQTDATQFINDFWPYDGLLHISFSQPAMIFPRDGLLVPQDVKTTLHFQANRHGGFGARGALFVNDAADQSVYVNEFFSNGLDFVKR